MEKKFKLPKKVKAKWVKALRSGKYEQGTGALETKFPDRYCCLGVAKHLGIAKQRPTGDEFLENTFIPNKIQKKLSEYNDYGKSFKWIAAYIERYL